MSDTKLLCWASTNNLYFVSSLRNYFAKVGLEVIFLLPPNRASTTIYLSYKISTQFFLFAAELLQLHFITWGIYLTLSLSLYIYIPRKCCLWIPSKCTLRQQIQLAWLRDRIRGKILQSMFWNRLAKNVRVGGRKEPLRAQVARQLLVCLSPSHAHCREISRTRLGANILRDPTRELFKELRNRKQRDLGCRDMHCLMLVCWRQSSPFAWLAWVS